MKNTQLIKIIENFQREREKNNADSITKCSALASILWSQHFLELKEDIKADWEFFESTLSSAKEIISRDNYFIDIAQGTLLISKDGKLLHKTKPFSPKEISITIFGEERELLELLFFQKELFLLFNLYLQKDQSKEKLIEEEAV